jgi:DNA helicase-2/ATP-dependent DNA helicase PcrA
LFSERAWQRAVQDHQGNPEQTAAINETGHCVVLAGPGSGKTKTLTSAMARALRDDVLDPRGLACITYSNECAAELEGRLQAFGIAPGDRTFIGTVHGFALSQVLMPYSRCVPGGLPSDFRLATSDEIRAAIVAAHAAAINIFEDPHERWKYAAEKRKRDVDRSRPEWYGTNIELARFIEAYEAELRRQGLIDYEDMPLLAFRMLKEHGWIREAIRARYPILFVDEYQDLGHALHELVHLLCFDVGIRLFAVGDVDQTIYGFAGASGDLLEELAARPDVRTIRLRFNYRSGARIIRASLGALGEDRDYSGVAGAPDGDLTFFELPYGLDYQAQVIATSIVPGLIAKNFEPDEIAVLYRNQWQGDRVAAALRDANIPFVRTDPKALVRRNSRLSRLIEGCARWVTGGWRDGDPTYGRLLSQAISLVFGRRIAEPLEQQFSTEFMAFLSGSIDTTESTHEWLTRFSDELLDPWRAMARNPEQDWDKCAEMIANTDPAEGLDLPLRHFAGRIEGTGRVTLTTMHSAKGREFDAVILYGVNASDLPNDRDRRNDTSLRDARRSFYVGVTRPRKELCLVYQEYHQSPWITELIQRVNAG